MIAAFREHKLISGEIKPSTGHRVYRHHMNHVLGAVAVAAPPQNAKQLLEALARIWADQPGGRTCQIQIQSTATLLSWAVAERRLGEDWYSQSHHDAVGGGVATDAAQVAEPRACLGFYAINAHAIGVADMPSDAAPRPPRSNLISGVFLSHLAVDGR